MASSYGSEILWSFAILFWIQFGFSLILHKKLMTNFKYYDMQIQKIFGYKKSVELFQHCNRTVKDEIRHYESYVFKRLKGSDWHANLSLATGVRNIA